MSLLGKLSSLAGIESDGNTVNIPGLNVNIGRGKTFYLDPTHGAATGNAKTPRTAITTLAGAFAKITSGYHDKIEFLAGSSGCNIAAAFDWTASYSHLVGVGAPGRMSQRCRFTHGVNTTTLVTVSGHGNTFENLQFQHGRGSATNVNLMTLTGNRNTFINCHFNGPINATDADTAYDLIRISGEEYYFKNCFIGADNIFFTGNGAQAGASLIEFTASSAPRGVFENCIFSMKADAVYPVFLKPMYDLSEAGIYFINCAFMNIGTSALTYAIDYDGTATGLNANAKMFFLNSSFAGVTDIIPAGDEAYVYFGGANTPINQVTGGASVALFNGIACNPDVA
jgi:hypothetical protein